MVRITTVILAFGLFSGPAFAAWPPTLDLDWFDLPDARAVDCPSGAFWDRATTCIGLDLSYKAVKRHLRKVVSDRGLDAQVEVGPWRRDGTLRRMALISSAVAVYVLFDEERRVFGIVPPRSCLGPRPAGVLDGDEIDEEPEGLETVRPRYPALARSHRGSGLVIVHAVIRSDGRVSDPCLQLELPAGYGFGEAAVEGLEKWRFRPAEVGGEPVDVMLSILVNFDIR